MIPSADADKSDAAGERGRSFYRWRGVVAPLGDGKSTQTCNSFCGLSSCSHLKRKKQVMVRAPFTFWYWFLQDEAPVDANTVSNAEERAGGGDTLEPEQESLILETKQIPSPLV